ncbi:DUF3450 domain-containing protein [Yoonia maritima]|uniref:DUF3450 domain-containing protein n=1 Tax=Yoonia maritima TaxID=1435347 RepID=UPI0013A66E53|nr:DUF3450 domain-containing protein [Yoonia maritima]
MTDMTVGFLFIMMILLAFFASQAGDPDAVSKIEYERVVEARDSWQQIAETRQETIERLEAQLAKVLQEKRQLEALVLQLTADLTASETRIENLEERLRQLIIEIEELRLELAELKQVDPLEAYLAQVTQTRREVLTRLRDAIKADFPDLQVELSEESDALRFQGEGLFASGRSDLTRDRRAIVARGLMKYYHVLRLVKLRNSTVHVTPDL